MWATKGCRSGLRVRGGRGHPLVHCSVIRFSHWLRLQFDFPVRVPVYLSPRSRLTTLDGEVVTASFFAPWKPEVEPYIRIATGDYAIEAKTQGRDRALASFLCSLAHEIVHYRQWIETGQTWENGTVAKAGAIVRKYAKTVSRP